MKIHSQSSALVACAVLFLSWTPNLQTSRAGSNDLKRAEAYEQVERLAEVMLLIEKHYVKEKAYGELLDGALEGMLRSLDPHSNFLEPEELIDMQEETEGKYGGIGVYIDIRDDVLTVVAPIEDTPAFHAGLKSGDRIIKIENEPTTGIGLNEVVKKLRGEAETEVNVTVLPAGEDKPREVKLVRETINVTNVKGTRMLDKGIGYLRITQFASPTAEAVDEALSSLEKEGMDALILDLRSNHGGLLQSAVEVAEKFLPKGVEIVTTRSRQGREAVLTADGKRRLTDIPLAVLVNSGTASASEIVAGALRDHNRAVLVGDITYGKGSVQSIIRLKTEKDAAVRLTTAYYHTPGGQKIHKTGIEPDIKVYIPPDEWHRVRVSRLHRENPEHYTEEERREYKDVVDRQLREAVRLLKGIRIFQFRR
ncbi:MAG: S41 family peptidase [Kiritimatiellia bacterium]